MPVNHSTRTTCAYCGVGCGVIATQEADGSVAIKGDADHPANFGRLCSKGTALGETLGLEGRLLHPERADGQRLPWGAALDEVAARFSDTIRASGPDSVAFYVSGQLLTEDYYVANKLMKGFIGTGNIDTNSRLCMASSVAGHRRAFGSDTVPGCYEDIELADLVVLVGSNLAWCHPVLFQRLIAAREAHGTKIVVIDPRRTMSAEAADLHLPVAPDSDVALFGGLLKHLVDRGCVDADFVAQNTVQMPGFEATLRGFSHDLIIEKANLSGESIDQFYNMFARHEKVVTIYSQGVNQSVCGTDKVNAILNCHLVTGRIGKPGMGPFSVTGQPNAMGGREVGGLANMLAAHMNIEDEAARERVKRFWASPRIAQQPGLKAVDLFRAMKSGQIKALWIMGTNPADSLPDADAVQEALQACPFVVVSDCIRDTDTTRFAHLLLPTAAWGEKDGTVTNSERRISRQRAFLPLPGEAQPDWWMLAEVAKRMGFSGFEYDGPAAIFAEHAALSGFENAGDRDFDISAYAAISAADYDTLAPFQWPQAAGKTPKTTRFFGKGGFFTPDHKARMLPIPVLPAQKALSVDYPLWLNTARLRDQWHTMTRTGRAPRLMGQFGEPFCEIHPDDAARFGIAPATLVEVKTPRGSAILRALITDRQQRGAICVPMHWTDQFAAKGRINAATEALTDPFSGQPGLKSCAAALKPFAANWYGFAVCAHKPRPDAPYWALAKAKAGYRLELAGDAPVADWQAYAADLFGASVEAEWVAYFDDKAGLARLAAFEGDHLIGALFVSPHPVALSREFLADALAEEHAQGARLRVLAGRGGADRPDPGAILCACFQVGVNQIVAAIAGGATSVNAIGEALKAGTNCGSCRSDLARLLARDHVVAAKA